MLIAIRNRMGCHNLPAVEIRKVDGSVEVSCGNSLEEAVAALISAYRSEPSLRANDGQEPWFWRDLPRGEPPEGIDLSRRDMSRLDLDRPVAGHDRDAPIVLRGWKFDGAVLRNASFSGVRFERCSFVDTQFRRGSVNAEFVDCDMRGCKLIGSRIWVAFRSCQAAGMCIQNKSWAEYAIAMADSNFEGARFKRFMACRLRASGCSFRHSVWDTVTVREKDSRPPWQRLRPDPEDHNQLADNDFSGALFRSTRVQSHEIRGNRMDGADLRGLDLRNGECPWPGLFAFSWDRDTRFPRTPAALAHMLASAPYSLARRLS